MERARAFCTTRGGATSGGILTSMPRVESRGGKGRVGVLRARKKYSYLSQRLAKEATITGIATPHERKTKTVYSKPCAKKGGSKWGSAFCLPEGARPTIREKKGNFSSPADRGDTS